MMLLRNYFSFVSEVYFFCSVIAASADESFSIDLMAMIVTEFSTSRGADDERAVY
jgi:hypothetical protein